MRVGYGSGRFESFSDSSAGRECIPTEKLNEVAIWEALLAKMPLMALIRNLGKMTSIGLLTPMSEAVRRVTENLSDAEYLQRSRIHPIAVLVAAKTYASGHGLKGSLSWTPVSAINDVLDAAFYHCFRNVIPAGKRTLIAIDVSGSVNDLLTPVKIFRLQDLKTC